MDEYKVTDEMQALLEQAENEGWESTSYLESDGKRAYVEMEKYSPAGEDFLMYIDFEPDNQVETFLDNLCEYAAEFDTDEHAEMWLESRGKGGCPSTLKELLDDARAIKKMIKELSDKLRTSEVELNDEQVARCDEVYNAVYEMCKVMCENTELEWDMHYIGEIAELTANLLVTRGERVRFPAVVTTEYGLQKIEEYYEPEDREC